MNKIWLVIQREYSTRVRKKSFIIMTILGPLLFAVFYAAIILVAMAEEEKEHTVMVVDKSATLLGDKLKKYEVLHPGSKLKFVWKYTNYEEARENIYTGDYDAILYIPPNPVGNANLIQYFFKEQGSLSQTRTIERELEFAVEEEKLKAYQISREDYESIKTPISIPRKKIKKDGTEESVHSEVRFFVGMASSILIYLFIFMYGVQVLRGVMEEKTNRIIEVIVSSVKPFQLMMGKILGIALVGLTQFFIWIVFSGIVFAILGVTLAPSALEQAQTGEMTSGASLGGLNIGEFLLTLNGINFGWLIFCFVIYFLGGYLLYASLFAAVGSAVDSEADTQQFMLPITLPLFFSIGIAQMTLQNPGGIAAEIFSYFPLTSPIVMMVRIPNEVPIIQVVISMLLLGLGFLGTTWLAAKIYRTGILLYGKKVSYRELLKWLRY